MTTNPNSDDPVDAAADPSASWLDEPSRATDEVDVAEYDIVSSPNDWNFSTIVSFIESGAMRIPAFQRSYVWDRKRASKLIESLLIGLPVPQVFLYEESRNRFIVIDGQQRLLSLYFFAKGRFPRPTIRGSLRPKLAQGVLDESLLHDDGLFEPFKLALPKFADGRPNRYHGLTYPGLKEDKTSLDLRTIRNIVVKQTSPSGNDAVFEIFSRLNTGGVNLSPQEIRASLYHSELFTRILELNLDIGWRRLVGTPDPDPRMRDTEFLFRGLALARDLDTFSGSMAAFVNKFCQSVKGYNSSQTAEAADTLHEFFMLFESGDADVFMRSGKFSGVLFESFFAAWVRMGMPTIEPESLQLEIRSVKEGTPFANTLQEGSTKPTNIRARVELAEAAVANASL